MKLNTESISVGWVLGLAVCLLSLMILVLKMIGIFPLEAPETILFVFTGLLGLARLT